MWLVILAVITAIAAVWAAAICRAAGEADRWLEQHPPEKAETTGSTSRTEQ